MDLPPGMTLCGCGSVLKYTSYWRHIETAVKHRRWLETPRPRRLLATLEKLHKQEEEAHTLYNRIQDERTHQRWMSITSEIGKVSFICYEVPVEYERLRDERRRLAAQE